MYLKKKYWPGGVIFVKTTQGIENYNFELFDK